MNNPKFIRIVGRRKRTQNSREEVLFGEFECPYCGKEFDAVMYEVKNGHTKSCGCYKVAWGKVVRKHGESATRLYKIYYSMLSRCSNTNAVSYRFYGGKGIIVCEEWVSDYFIFKKWAIENGYNESLEIDRINPDGNYEPSNCRWITIMQNRQNTRLICSTNKTGYRGVYYKNSTNRYIDSIQNNKKRIELGYFKTPEEAALAYNKYVVENNTFHPLNNIQ